MSSPNLHSITEAAALLRDRSISARQLMQSCLDRIALREAVVNAWVTLDTDTALAAADAADRALAAGDIQLGPLHGIPVGIKDIFDVAGLPTTGGTSAYVQRIPDSDAASVARLKAAGAIVIGKTVTTAFAMGDPGPTTNPWKADHTPGGSSSGSAAAVADRMCLAALGTQTAGSVIRPCSYTGLAGIKPTHANVDVDGVIPLSWQLDHVGALTRTVADARLLWHLLSQAGAGARPAAVDATSRATRPARLWRARELFESGASAAMNSAIDAHCEQLQAQGVDIVERALPASFDAILDNHQIIMATEAAASHAENFQQRGAHYPPRIRQLIETGQSISAVQYSLALQHRKFAIQELHDALKDVTGMISPAAVDSAPAGLDHTGDRTFNAPSSYLGLPVVTYPVGVDTAGLPLGVQIMGCANSEDNLLAAAEWCEQVAAFNVLPADLAVASS